jgi:LacI family transcriptional regulator
MSDTAVTPRKPTTIKHVAAHAGVSAMTVSVVLNNTGSKIRISEATRERVLESARALGYRPNAAARSLRLQRSDTVAFYSGSGINPYVGFFGQVIAGMQDACAQYGKDLLLHGASGAGAGEAVLDKLAGGRMDGLVAYLLDDADLVRRLAESGHPVVVLADPSLPFPSVTPDDEAGGRLVLEHLAARGHQRVAARRPTRPGGSIARRHGAFLAAAGAAGVAVEEFGGDGDDILAPDFRPPFLDRRPSERPTAVACWVDAEAFHLIGVLKSHGLRVPEDIAVTGFDGLPAPQFGLPRLTTVHAPWDAAGRRAVELLLARLAGEEVPQRTVLPVHLVLGETA